MPTFVAAAYPVLGNPPAEREFGARSRRNIVLVRYIVLVRSRLAPMARRPTFFGQTIEAAAPEQRHSFSTEPSPDIGNSPDLHIVSAHSE
jgi:hypothetical protein